MPRQPSMHLHPTYVYCQAVSLLPYRFLFDLVRFNKLCRPSDRSTEPSLGEASCNHRPIVEPSMRRTDGRTDGRTGDRLDRPDERERACGASREFHSPKKLLSQCGFLIRNMAPLHLRVDLRRKADGKSHQIMASEHLVV